MYNITYFSPHFGTYRRGTGRRGKVNHLYSFWEAIGGQGGKCPLPLNKDAQEKNAYDSLVSMNLTQGDPKNILCQNIRIPIAIKLVFCPCRKFYSPTSLEKTLGHKK